MLKKPSEEARVLCAYWQVVPRTEKRVPQDRLPTRQQTVNNTLVVIACVIIVGIFIWIIDILFGLGVQTLLSFFRRLKRRQLCQTLQNGMWYTHTPATRNKVASSIEKAVENRKLHD